jgi:type VI protein secretion system component VasF
MGATLGEVENEANEQRLAVFASCISLGFLGMHMDPSKPLDTPDTVRTEMRRIWTRVKGKYEREKNGRVTQQAYEHNDERDLTPDPVHGTLGWVVVLVAFIVGLIVVQVVMYRTASSKIQASLDSLAKQQVAAQPPAKPEGSK